MSYFSQARFLSGEYGIRHSSEYPIGSLLSDSEFSRRYLEFRPNFYQHWNDLRFGTPEYSGLEQKGIDGTSIALNVANLLVATQSI